MTALLDGTAVSDDSAVVTDDQVLDTGDAVDPAAAPPADDANLGAGRVALATALVLGGAAWMAGGIFNDALTARALAIAGVLVGAGIGWVSHRSRGLGFVQYLGVPAALLAGALVTLPFTTGGSASLPSLVGEAVRAGGLGQPPVPFDPGWRFLLMALFVVLGAGAASLSVTLRQPMIAVGIAGAVTVLTGLVQPQDSVVLSASVAVVLLVAGLSVARGAALGAGANAGGAFEMRRLARSGGFAAALVVLLVVMSRADILYPTAQHDQVIPPTRPTVPPPMADMQLFTVRMSRPVPLRLGDIDVYDSAQGAWLLPPYDPAQTVTLGGDGRVNDSAVSGRPTQSITVVIDQEPGHTLPALADPTRVMGISGVQYIPRSQTVRLSNRLAQGEQYTVTGPATPTGAQLAAAAQPPAALAQFTAAPPPPDAVHLLLLKAPKDLWDRLQFLRTQLYAHVVAAGAGVPTDVSPARVVDMLDGKTASPYEITAAEALLARWAGVPARIGYGYLAQTPQSDGSYSIHPSMGATWLEAYFSGYGWVPVTGVPAHAQPSTSTSAKNSQPEIRASDDLALVVYATVRIPSLLPLYEVVRWWMLVVLPLVLAAVLALVGYPGLLRALRSRRRRRFASHRGPRARIAVAYAELRDLARDLRIGEGSASPLGFLRAFSEDREHEELAWLVTRAMWGDLRRDLRDEDARAAEHLSGSLMRRLRHGQPGLYVAMARFARESLRHPYTDEVPNLWWEPRRPRLRLPLGHVRPLRRAGAVATAALLITSCGVASAATITAGPPLASLRLAPPTLGQLSFHREPGAELKLVDEPHSLVTEARVLTIHDTGRGTTVGSLQISHFDASVIIDDEFFKQVQPTINAGRFRRVELSGQRVYERQLEDQTIDIWFLPGDHAMALLVTLRSFGVSQTRQLLQSLVTYEHGGTAPLVVPASPSPAGSPSSSPSVSPSPSAGGTGA
ncbi:MAG: DUF3488 and transglutaminase-like domain-containing protein [Candidatus Dormibacteria bacterium]